MEKVGSRSGAASTPKPWRYLDLTGSTSHWGLITVTLPRYGILALILSRVLSQKLGMRHNGPPQPSTSRRQWTLEEEALLVKLREQERSYADIANILKRTEFDVAARFLKLVPLPSPVAENGCGPTADRSNRRSSKPETPLVRGATTASSISTCEEYVDVMELFRNIPQPCARIQAPDTITNALQTSEVARTACSVAKFLEKGNGVESVICTTLEQQHMALVGVNSETVADLLLIDVELEINGIPVVCKAYLSVSGS